MDKWDLIILLLIVALLLLGISLMLSDRKMSEPKKEPPVDQVQQIFILRKLSVMEARLYDIYRKHPIQELGELIQELETIDDVYVRRLSKGRRGKDGEI